MCPQSSMIPIWVKEGISLEFLTVFLSAGCPGWLPNWRKDSDPEILAATATQIQALLDQGTIRKLEWLEIKNSPYLVNGFILIKPDKLRLCIN